MGIKGKIILIQTIQKEVGHHFDIFQRTTLQWTSTKVNVYMHHHQTRSFARNMLVTCLSQNFHIVT